MKKLMIFFALLILMVSSLADAGSPEAGYVFLMGASIEQVIQEIPAKPAGIGRSNRSGLSVTMLSYKIDGSDTIVFYFEDGKGLVAIGLFSTTDGAKKAPSILY